MPSTNHGSLTTIHRAANWTPADATALAAISPVSGDDGKIAWQQDNDTLWMLVDYTGATWVRIEQVIRWTPADATALAAIVPVNGDDGRFAWQQDTDQLWLLVDYSVPTWKDISGSGGGDVTSSSAPADNQVVRYDGTSGDTIQPTGLVVNDSDTLQMADNIIERPELKDYGVTHNAQSSVSGAATINLENGNSQKIVVTGNITSMDMQNWPASGIDGSLILYVEQGGTGSYTIVWDTAIDWPGGVAPTISTAVGSMDIYAFRSIDGGTTIYGVQVGADFQ